MTTAATSLLGLALPVTGELSGTWGDTVNNSITALLDSAVAGTTTLSADADVTLTTTTLAANQAREAIILWTAAGTVTRYITAPAQSKIYAVLNKSSTQSIVLRGVGPTTGVTVLAGKQAMVAWDGTDYVEISSGYVDGPATSTDNAVARFDGTDGKLLQNSVVIIADTTGNMSGVGTLSSGAITSSSLTATRVLFAGTSGLIQDDADLTFNGTILTSTGFAGPLNGTVGATTANTGAFTTLTTSSTVTISGGTANGVAYLDGSKVLTTGSALKWDLTTLTATGSGSAGEVAIRTGDTASNTSYLTFGTTNYNRAQISVSGSALTEGYMAFTTFTGGSGAEAMRLTSSGLEVKQAQLIGYSSYSGLGSYGLAVAGNVGIGTSSPGGQLDVYTDSYRRFLVSYPSIYVTRTTLGVSAYLEADGGTDTLNLNVLNSAGKILFSKVGATQMTLDSSGNLGLGVTPSAWSAGRKVFESVAGAVFSENSDTFGFSQNCYNGASNWTYTTSAAAAMCRASAGAYQWFIAPSGTAGAAITFTQAMTLDASGRLLVGTTNVLSNSLTTFGNNTGATGKAWGIATLSNAGGIAPPTAVGLSFGWNYSDAGGENNIVYGVSAGSSPALVFSSYNGTTVTERMRLDSSGNLGLGVTPSASTIPMLEVGYVGSTFSSRTLNTVDMAQNAYYSSGFKFANSIYASGVYEIQSGNHYWLTSSNTPSAGAAIIFTQAMTLNASGNLGVGTTSPAGKLEVNGTVRLGSLDINLTTANAAVWISGSDFGVGTFYGNALKFLTSNVERMRLDASGNLLVGTTSQLTGHLFTASTNAGASLWGFGPYVGSASNFYVSYNGNTGVYLVGGATAWTANSDERLKTNFVSFENAAAKVCTLRAGTGRYLTDGESVSRSFLIAQDVQKVLPEAVSVKDDETGTLGVAYTDVIPLLVAAIKEQQAMIEDLKTRLAAAGI